MKLSVVSFVCFQGLFFFFQNPKSGNSEHLHYLSNSLGLSVFSCFKDQSGFIKSLQCFCDISPLLVGLLNKWHQHWKIQGYMGSFRCYFTFLASRLSRRILTPVGASLISSEVCIWSKLKGANLCCVEKDIRKTCFKLSSFLLIV